MALSEYDKKHLNGLQQQAVLTYTAQYERAIREGNQEAARMAHEGAEAIRRQAGYSGGVTGGEKLSVPQTVSKTTATSKNGKTTYQTTTQSTKPSNADYAAMAKSQSAALNAQDDEPKYLPAPGLQSSSAYAKAALDNAVKAKNAAAKNAETLKALESEYRELRSKAMRAIHSGRSDEAADFADRGEELRKQIAALRNAGVETGEKLGLGATVDRSLNAAAYGVASGDVNAVGTVLDAVGAKKTAKRLQELSDSMGDQAGAYTSQAKDAKSGLGKLAVDVGINAAQMGMDAVGGVFTGGNNLIPMAIRSFGGGAQEARQSGASTARQLAYGAGSAAVEVLTEKMFDGLAGVYGKGGADEIVEKAIKKLTKNEAARRALTIAASAAGESIEEFASGIVNPALRTIYNGKSLGQNYSELEASDILYDMLVGGIMGAVGGTVDAVARPRQQNASTGTPAPAQRVSEAQTAEAPAGNLTPATNAGAEAQKNAAGAKPTAAYMASPAQDAGHSFRPILGKSGQSLGQIATQESKAIVASPAELVKNNGADFIKQHGDEAFVREFSRALEQNRVKMDAVGNLYATDPRDHIDNRDRHDVGDRSMQAFQYQNPEIHPYYEQVASVLLDELGSVQKGGELIVRGQFSDGGQEFLRTKRGASDAIIELRDDYNISYADIEKALRAIIEDKGQENIAVAKRMELLIDELLENDYRSAWGNLSEFIDLDAYRAAKDAIAGAQDRGAHVDMLADVDAEPRYLKRPEDFTEVRSEEEAPRYLEGDRRNTERSAEFRRAEQIAKIFGATMEVAEVENGADGKYRNGTITISPNASSPVMTVMVHELTHHMETSGRYEQFSKTILDHIARESDVGVSELEAAFKARYAARGITLDSEAARREIVAQYAQENLFQDEQSINRLARENRSLVQAIRDWLSDLAVKLKGTSEERFIRNAERMYERALQGVGDTTNTNGGVAQYTMGDTNLQRSYIDYNDTQQRDDGIQQAMAQSMAAGNIVQLGVDEIGAQLQKANWDNVREARRYLKDVVTEVMGDSVYFRIGDGTLEAYVTGEARNHFAGTPTAEKAAAMQKFNELVQKSTYAFSSEHDVHSNEGGRVQANVWDSFVVPVQIGEDTMPFIFSVRSIDDDFRAQIYGMNMQTETAFSHGYASQDGLQSRTPNYGGSAVSGTEAAYSHGYGYREDPLGRTPSYGGSAASGENHITNQQNVKPEFDVRPLAAPGMDDTKYSLGGSFDELLSDYRPLPTAEQIENETEAWRVQSMADAVNEADMAESERRGRIANEGMQLEDGTQVSPEVAEAIERMRSRVEPVTVPDNLARTTSKADFTGTRALQKLGVKIANSVGLYRNLEQLKGQDQAAKQIAKERRRAESRLDATKAERTFAKSLAEGLYTEADIPASMDRAKVTELADYYRAEQHTSDDRIKGVRRTINRELEGAMAHLFRDSDRFKPESGLVMSYRTPQRIMNAIFGETRARAINEAIFNPVAENEAERIRFINRMFDEVRTFEGKDGKASALTKEESALVQQVIEGKAAAEEVAGLEMRSAIESAAQNLRSGEDIGDVSREFSLSADERALAQRYARWLETESALESGNVDNVKIENAVKKYGEMFDDFYDAINDFLVAHGYEPIGFIKGYAPHIQSEENQNLLNKAFKAMGINTDVSNLPTSIAGQTGYYKPNKRWNPFFLHRTSEQTTYDIVSAYESYVDYMSDILYHTDDIMRVRQAANYFRKTYAPDEIKNTLDWASELKYGSAEQKAEFLRDQGVLTGDSELNYRDVSDRMDEYVDEMFRNIEKTTKYSDLVMWLDNYANLLAGKQNMADRGSEIKGRTLLNLGNKLQRAFARTQVAANVSSMLNQTAQLPQIRAELGAKYTAAAIRDIVGGQARKASWVESSDFLTEKNGIDYLVQTPGEKILSGMFWGAGFTDEMVSTVAVRGKYLQEIDAGKSPTEAMKAADKFGKEIMGSRAKGSIPTAFTEKNIISQMVNVFQVEALNSWEHLTQDLPREFRETARTEGTVKASRDLAGVLTKTLLSTFILNRIAEGVYGGTPAPFDILGLAANFIASGEELPTNDYLLRILNQGWAAIFGEALLDDDDEEDKPFNWKQAIDDTAYNISNDVPFVRNVSGVLGLGDNTLPLPDIYGGVTDVSKAIDSHGVASGETVKAIGSLAAELLPGGKQAKKLGLGAEALIRGGDFSGYGENERLKYPIEATPANVIKTLLFGKYSTSASDRYYAKGETSLSVNQTKLWREMVNGGADSSDVYDTIQTYRKIGNDDELTSFEQGVLRRELLRETDLTDQQKLDMYRGLNSSATSRVEKFEAMMDAGMDFGTVMDVYDAYALYNNDDTLTAAQKATEFAKWVDESGLTKKQAELVKDQLKYFVSTPAQASRYEKLTDAGLDSERAYDLTNQLAALVPEAGKENVSDMQRFRAIAVASIPDEDKIAAIGSIMGTDMTTESGGKSQYAKMLDMLDAGVTLDEYLDLKEADALDAYTRYLSVGGDYGITSGNYIDFKDHKGEYDEDGNGSFTQKETAAAIDGIFGDTLTQEQKAVLWQMQNKSWKAKNNPYSSSIGQSVYDGLHEEPEDDEPRYLAAP